MNSLRSGTEEVLSSGEHALLYFLWKVSDSSCHTENDCIQAYWTNKGLSVAINSWRNFAKHIDRNLGEYSLPDTYGVDSPEQLARLFPDAREALLKKGFLWMSQTNIEDSKKSGKRKQRFRIIKLPENVPFERWVQILETCESPPSETKSGTSSMVGSSISTVPRVRPLSM